MARIEIKNRTSPDSLTGATQVAKQVAALVPPSSDDALVATKSNAGRPAGLLTQGSATETVSKMEVGETVALAKRLPKGSRADIEKLYAGMSATLQTASRRAGEGREDFEVKIERGQWKTKDSSTMLVVALSRVS